MPTSRLMSDLNMIAVTGGKECSEGEREYFSRDGERRKSKEKKQTHIP
jgi:hypothetical protein